MVGVPGPDDHPQDDPRCPEGRGRVLDTYLAALAGRLREDLGERLLGVVLTGSAALGAYEPGRSDVDVIAVVDGPLPADRARGLARRVSHAALPCPARLLELVVVRRDAARPFELNLNTGAGREDHVGVDPAAEAAHWFPIDRAIARERGRSVLGPPPRELLDDPGRAALLEAVRESLAWHAEHQPRDPDAVLNACRAWRWARTGRWTSKRRAAQWARERRADPAVVETALVAREAGGELDAGAVAEFLVAARAAIDATRPSPARG